MKRSSLAVTGASLLALALATPNASVAGSSTATMAVSATVTGLCSLSTTPLAFGNAVIGLTTQTSATLTYTCAPAASSPNVVLTSAANSGVSGASGSLYMQTAGNPPYTIMPYTLFANSTPITPGTTVISQLVADGAPHDYVLTGKLSPPSGQPATTYFDTLTFTINY